jgi:hypothetical protein
VALSHAELVALYLESAFRKIQELLPQEVRVSPAKLDDFLSFDAGPLHTPDAEVFSAVLAALRLRRRLLIRYRSLSSDRTTKRRVHPYHVFNHRGDWYLAASDEPRKDVPGAPLRGGGEVRARHRRGAQGDGGGPAAERVPAEPDRGVLQAPRHARPRVLTPKA